MTGYENRLKRQHISAKVFKSYIHYISLNYPLIRVDELCESAGVNYSHLLDDTNSVSVEFDWNFTELCKEKTGQKDLCYQVGLHSLTKELMGKPLYYFVSLTQTCESVYKTISKYTQIYNKVLRCKYIETKRGQIELHFLVKKTDLSQEEFEFVKKSMDNLIENTRGTLSAVPILFSLPPADVTLISKNCSKDTLAFIFNCRFKPQKSKKLNEIIILSVFLGLTVLTYIFLERTFKLRKLYLLLISSWPIASYYIYRVCKLIKTSFELSATAQEYSEKLDERYNELQLTNENLERSLIELSELRDKLEIKVAEKTSELFKKNVELEEALKNLKKTQADLIQSEKLAAIGTLAAGIAHEMNNSLNGVYGLIRHLKDFASELQNEESKQRYDLYLRTQQKGLEFTLKIIKSLENYGGIDPFKTIDIKVSEIIDSIVCLVSNGVANIKVTQILPENCTIRGEHTSIYQIFMNLIINAADAMVDGGELVIEACEKENETIITFTDTGHGIPDNIKTRIFEPFFTTKDVGKGTGLGLYNVMREVKNHGGEIKVESAEKGGTKFIVTLPKVVPKQRGEN